MRFMTMLLAFLSLFLCSVPSFAQNPVPFDVHSAVWGGQFAPQGPEAMGMIRYGDDAPDFYHGTMSLAIPLYTWSDRLFNIPISLSYSSSGLRPGLACSDEGLGWSLIAGGVITREIRGIPDESYNTSYNASDQFKANPSGREDPIYSYIVPDPHHMPTYYAYSGRTIRGFANRYNGSTVSDLQQYIYTGKLGDEYVCGSVHDAQHGILIENEPDIFNFSFMGRSGSFILMPNHRIRIIGGDSPSGEYEISFHCDCLDEGRTSYFTIRDGQGVVYTFADIESTDSFDVINGTDSGGTAISSWKLTTITHPSGKIVTFHYTDCDNMNLSPTVTKDHLKISDGNGLGTGAVPYEQWTDPEAYHDNSILLNLVHTRRLDHIDMAGRGTVSFTWDDDDRLERVTVRNADSRVIRDCSLEYYVPKNTSMGRNLSLSFLTGVSIDGQGEYRMTYDSADEDHGFPEQGYGSTVNDLWFTDAYGYYNSISLLALYSRTSDLHALSETIRQNRTPDGTRTRMGMLTSVTYPTGGRTVFSYEQNRYSRIHDPHQAPDPSNPVTGGMRVKQIDTYDDTGEQVQCKKISYLAEDGNSSGVLLQVPDIYYKYHILDDQQMFHLRLDREAVSTASSIGYTKDSHIEYLRVTEEVSRTANSQVLSRTVHNYMSSANPDNVNLESEYIAENSDDQEEYIFVNEGTVLDEWQNHGRTCYAGRDTLTIRLPLASSDPIVSTRTAYGSYPDPDGSVYSGKFIHFGKLYQRVYNTRSPYLSSVSVSRTEADGSSSVTSTDVQADSFGRISSVTTQDSECRDLVTSYTYHSVLPGLIASKDVTRGGEAVSSTDYDYLCLDQSRKWYVPEKVRTGVISGSSVVAYRTDRTFGIYDQWGNPCRVTDAAGRTDVWSWGHSGLHPVSCTRSDGHGGSMTTSWTWIPMVGQTSVTAPSGRTTHYTYDSHGRLTSVKDNSLATLTDYSYYIASAGDALTFSDKTHVVTSTHLSQSSSNTDIAYYDGLGRPVQTVMKSASAAGDMISVQSYDALGRSAGEHLPFGTESATGMFRSNWEDIQYGYYDGRGLAGEEDRGELCSAVTYENSPEGRRLSQTLPGHSFSGYPTIWHYSFNSDELAGAEAGMYSSEKTTDGDGRTTVVWKDREGRTVREETVLDASDTLVTSYEYDARGNLIRVIQPEGTEFTYAYDGLNRMVTKSVPGADVEYYVYDSAGRVVLSQDGNLRSAGRWLYSIYDDFDCLVEKDVISCSLTRSGLQAKFPAEGHNNSFSPSDYSRIAVLEEHVYDRHGYVPDPDDESAYYGFIPIQRQLPSFVGSVPVCAGVYLLVDEDANIQSGIIPSLSDWTLGGGETYFDAEENVNPAYYICSSSVTSYKFYYIPLAYQDIIQEAVDCDPTGYLSLVDSVPLTEYIPTGESATVVANPVNPAVPDYLGFSERGGDQSGAPAPAAYSRLGSSLNNLCSERVAILPADGGYANMKYVERAYYYDADGRIMQVVERNSAGGLSRTSTAYDRQGNVTVTEERHSTASGDDAERKTTVCSYDDRGRVLSERTTVNSGCRYVVSVVQGNVIEEEVPDVWSAVVTNDYNEIGQMAVRTVVAEEGVGEVYGYNLHGNLVSKHAEDMFASGCNIFDIQYRFDNPTKSGVQPSHTGNITQIDWRGPTLTDKSYSFQYDGAGRLADSRTWSGQTPTNSFSERAMSYDGNGNLLSFERYGADPVSPVDDLTYSYSGNRMTAITDAGVTYQYAYDSSGNMVTDGYRGLELEYNILNLPSSVWNSNTDTQTYFSYLVDGTKSGAVDESEEGIAYLGSMVYHRDVDLYEFESTPFGGGRICKSAALAPVEIFVTDHLGSVRAIEDGTTGDTVESNDYYPFGLRHPAQNSLTLSANRYRFSGKEELHIGDIGLIDFGARWYDPWCCRWTCADPMAEKYHGMSPYGYCAGNPVTLMDPDGQIIICGSWAQELMSTYKPNTNSYSEKVHRQLDNLKSLDSKLDNAISNLESSSSVYYIRPENERQDGGCGNCYNPKTNTVYYDPDNDNSPMVKYGDDKTRPAEAALAHELGHAENDENGTRVSYNVQKVKEGDKDEQEKLNQNERKPIDFENIVRDANGSKHRSYDYLNPFPE